MACADGVGGVRRTGASPKISGREVMRRSWAIVVAVALFILRGKTHFRKGNEQLVLGRKIHPELSPY